MGPAQEDSTDNPTEAEPVDHKMAAKAPELESLVVQTEDHTGVSCKMDDHAPLSPL